MKSVVTYNEGALRKFVFLVQINFKTRKEMLTKITAYTHEFVTFGCIPTSPPMKKLSILLCLLATTLLKAQFIPTVTWTYAIGSACYGSAAAADMDNDGKKEIVFATYANDGKVYCLNAEDGSVKWIYDIGGCGDVAVNIYDLNQDGQLDVFVNGSCNPTAFCINGNTGALTWSVASGGGDSPATIADIDADNKPEVIFGTFSGQIRIVNGENGTIAKIIPVFPNALQTDPVLVDANSDGNLDIMVGSYFNSGNTYTLHCIDYASSMPIWTNTWAAVSSFHAYHGGALADIDKDGKMEYVIGANNGLIRAFNTEDGSILWTKANPGSSCFGAISIADVNKDDTLDVIYHRLNSNQAVELLNGVNGKVQWTYTLNFGSFRGSAVSDLNGNGKLDLVSVGFNGRVSAVEPFTGSLWNFDALPYFPTYPGTIPYVDEGSAPLISDFDGDGQLDVFFAMGFGTYTVNPNSTGKAFMIKGGTGYCPNWLMFRNNNNRSGYLDPIQVLMQCAIVDVKEEEKENGLSVKISPQPFENKTQIRIEGMDPGKATLSIRDVQGRLISELKARDANIKEQEMSWEWNSEGLSPGIYLYQIEDGNKSLNGKLVKGK